MMMERCKRPIEFKVGYVMPVNTISFLKVSDSFLYC